MFLFFSHSVPARLALKAGGAAALIFLFLILPAPAAVHAQTAPPKRLPGINGNQCASCHVALSPLPKDHVDTGSFTWPECSACHVRHEETSLVGKLPTQHAHLLSGVGCDKCHSDVNKPEPVPAKVCTSCHEPSKLASLTEKLDPTNPHDTPHNGQDSDCNLCHHQHKKSVNDCEQCHNEFEFKVP